MMSTFKAERLPEKFAVDGFVPIVVNGSNHLVATVATRGEKGMPVAEAIAQALNKEFGV